MTENTFIEQSYSMVDEGINSPNGGQNKIAYREVVEEEELSDREAVNPAAPIMI